MNNQDFGLLIFIIETLIILTLSYGVLQARRLRTDRHRLVMTISYFVQVFIIIIWMGRRFFSRSIEDRFDSFDTSWLLITHVFLGITVGLLATGLIIAMTIDPEIHVSKMKRGKLLMRTTYGLWFLNYLIGTFNYFNRYYLEIDISFG